MLNHPQYYERNTWDNSLQQFSYVVSSVEVKLSSHWQPEEKKACAVETRSRVDGDDVCRDQSSSKQWTRRLTRWTCSHFAFEPWLTGYLAESDIHGYWKSVSTPRKEQQGFIQLTAVACVNPKEIIRAFSCDFNRSNFFSRHGQWKCSGKSDRKVSVSELLEWLQREYFSSSNEMWHLFMSFG